MTAAPARFTFDLDLGRNQDGAGFLSTAARSALLQQARADGYAEGFAAGEAGATAAAAQNLAAAAAATVRHPGAEEFHRRTGRDVNAAAESL